MLLLEFVFTVELVVLNITENDVTINTFLILLSCFFSFQFSVQRRRYTMCNIKTLTVIVTEKFTFLIDVSLSCDWKLG